MCEVKCWISYHLVAAHCVDCKEICASFSVVQQFMTLEKSFHTALVWPHVTDHIVSYRIWWTWVYMRPLQTSAKFQFRRKVNKVRGYHILLDFSEPVQCSFWKCTEMGCRLHNHHSFCWCQKMQFNTWEKLGHLSYQSHSRRVSTNLLNDNSITHNQISKIPSKSNTTTEFLTI